MYLDKFNLKLTFQSLNLLAELTNDSFLLKLAPM